MFRVVLKSASIRLACRGAAELVPGVRPPSVEAPIDIVGAPETEGSTENALSNQLFTGFHRDGDPPPKPTIQGMVRLFPAGRGERRLDRLTIFGPEGCGSAA